MGLIYFLVAIVATIAGASAGLGGGVIIKPILDSLGHYDLSTISVLSSITVFVMAVVSINKQRKYGVEIKYERTIYISVGSILGGILGEKFLKLIIRIIENETLVSIFQNIILAMILILILIYMNNKEKLRSFNVTSKIICILVGLSLGLISAFLGIGGGPINVCVLTLVFSLNTKEAAINSIIIILFSQSSKLLTVFLSGGFSTLNLSMLPFMIVGAILGGSFGASLNKNMSSGKILRIFNLVVASLISVNIYNVIF